MKRQLQALREVRLTRIQLATVTVASVLATGLVIATALGRTGAQARAVALLRRPRVERVVLPRRPRRAAQPAPVAARAPAPVARASVTEATTPSSPPAATTVTPTTTTAAIAPAPPKSKVKHVFVIAMTTPSYRASFGPASSMPYLDHELRPKGDLLSGYETLGHTDLPDYLAMVSGQAPNFDTERDCTTYAAFPVAAAPKKSGGVPGRGCVYPNTIVTIADQLDAAGGGWKGYFEDMGSTLPAAQQSCQHPNSNAVDPTLTSPTTTAPSTATTPTTAGGYATIQNPFVYFHSLLDLGDCQSDDLPLTQLTRGLRSAARTPNLVYIAPGRCDNGSDSPCPGASPTGPARADAFLRAWVPVVLSSPAYRHDGVLIITFASSSTQPGAGAPFSRPVHTGALVISRYAKAGAISTTRYTPYSVLRSIEDLFGLKPLAHAASAKSFATTAVPAAWARHG